MERVLMYHNSINGSWRNLLKLPCKVSNLYDEVSKPVGPLTTFDLRDKKYPFAGVGPRKVEDYDSSSDDEKVGKCLMFMDHKKSIILKHFYSMHQWCGSGSDSARFPIFPASGSGSAN